MKIRYGPHGLALTVGLWLFLGAGGCNLNRETAFTGRTMGTTFHVKIVSGYLQQTTGLQAKIEKRLDQINRSMSTYLKESEISRFNRTAREGEKFSISGDLLRVMTVARDLYALTEGAWDGTLNPLVDLWGFGGAQSGYRVPRREEIQRLLADVGFGQIEISAQGYLMKHKTGLSLDLASIAKGYAVDQIGELLSALNFDNFLVEIGGEVYAAGVRQDGRHWQVGINTPQRDADLQAVYRSVPLHNRAMATSGDYRNFFEAGGEFFAHVLDPRTGCPVNNGVRSVSVIAATCTFADGLATALMVMGPAKGLALVDRLANTECLIVVKGPDGGLQDYRSRGFPP
jgi:thiamine biosynthesis lipoprotein